MAQHGMTERDNVSALLAMLVRLKSHWCPMICGDTKKTFGRSVIIPCSSNSLARPGRHRSIGSQQRPVKVRDDHPNPSCLAIHSVMLVLLAVLGVRDERLTRRWSRPRRIIIVAAFAGAGRRRCLCFSCGGGSGGRSHGECPCRGERSCSAVRRS